MIAFFFLSNHIFDFGKIECSMIYVQFVVLGLVQGLCEFLPISSSGHLLLFSSLFGIEESLFVSVVLHFATLLSICVVMRKEIFSLIKKPFSKEMLFLVLSCVATFFVVVLIYDIAKNSYFESFLPFFFMLSGIILLCTDLFVSKKKNVGFGKREAFVMGICQGIAIFPALSRSGTTICAGLLAGGEKEKVAKHSFLMSIPIILASMVMEIFEISKTGPMNIPIFPLLISFIIAFFVGVFALKFMLRLTCKVKFRYFAYYLFLMSILCLVI